MIEFCKFCGQTVTQKRDNLYVCQAGHDNWIDVAAAALVYVVKDDSVLFGVRSIEPFYGKLAIPGGFLEIGEAAEVAAIREAKEEMGIDVELTAFLGTYSSTYGEGGKPVLNVVFIAEFLSGNIEPADDMNGGDPVWRSIDDLPEPAELAWHWQVAAQKDLKERFERA